MASIDKLDKMAARRNCGFWATEANKIHLQKEDFSFVGREYLLEPMKSRSRRICYMKGTQGGGSTVEILKSFHGMIQKRLPTGVLYLFPTADDVYDYSRAIMSPLITANPSSIGKWVKNSKGSTQSASLMTVNGANLYMRGAGLTKIVENEKITTKLQGIPVDRIVFDEIEQMDSLVIQKAIERMGNSEVKEEVYIGNPGAPGRGIDEIFNGSDEFVGSDRRHYFRKCQHCGEWTCPEEDGEFPDCVKLREDGTGYIGCKKCGKEVFVRDGEWVPADTEKSAYMHGYIWSQLTSPNNDPADILQAFNNPPHGNLTDVYRLKLGKAYVASSDRLTTAQVYSCCNRLSIMGTKDPGPCAFGLDVGKTYHLVIGKRTTKETYQIVKVHQFDEVKSKDVWADISQMIHSFNCRSGVIDIGPYESAARAFIKKQSMRISLCRYTENSTIDESWSQPNKVVTAHRTGIFDRTHQLVSSEGSLTLPQMSPQIKEFARQVCDPLKTAVEDKKTHEIVYRYSGKNDHYRNALNYFLLAADRKRLSLAKSSSGFYKKHRKVMNEYARI